ncbi:MAG: hypothetical protein L3J10_04590 [Sulfurimonas sp.]|nr:hypothetical protein [Sulfurimonas sp.]
MQLSFFDYAMKYQYDKKSMKFLNHTEVDTTMKYLNIDDDMEMVNYGL